MFEEPNPASLDFRAIDGNLAVRIKAHFSRVTDFLVWNHFLIDDSGIGNSYAFTGILGQQVSYRIGIGPT